MPAVFPNAVRIYGSKTDLVDTVLAEHVNLLQDEVTAVENTLGTGLLVSSWSGTFSTPSTHASVSARLANMEAGLLARPTNSGSGATGTWDISVTGNAATATKLATARTIALSGDVTGSTSFDGSGNATITAEQKTPGFVSAFLMAGL